MKYALKELPMLICKDIVDRKSHTKEKCAHIKKKRDMHASVQIGKQFKMYILR